MIDPYGRKPLGGVVWLCTFCQGTITADCPCCEPPRCNCLGSRNHAVTVQRNASREAILRASAQPALPSRT